MDPEKNFISEHEQLALRIMERHGFAVRIEPGMHLTASRRQHMVKNRGARALSAITDLQQWLLDDDAEVRKVARDEIRKALYVAYTGDHSQPEMAANRITNLPDRLLNRFLGPRISPDMRAPLWARPKEARTIRRTAIIAALLFGGGAGISLASGRLWLALPLLVLAVLLDIFDGSFSRLTRLRDPHLRWLSCVGSHATDLAMLAGVAVAQAGHGQPELAPLVVSAMLASVFASFVRVSALQAGYRFWRSPYERIVRWTAITAYTVASLFGNSVLGTVLLCLLLAFFALYELTRVLRDVNRVAANHGGFVIVNDNHTIDSWRLEDGDDAFLPKERLLGAGKRSRG